MTAPAPKIEHRVGALARRVTRAEEDLEGLIDTVYAIHRRAAGLELGMGKLLDHFGLDRHTDAEVTAVLDDQ
jgi:hypothetical protein